MSRLLNDIELTHAMARRIGSRMKIRRRSRGVCWSSWVLRNKTSTGPIALVGPWPGFSSSDRASHGELTPRHRPKRHGRYHRAPGGVVAGTLSMPEVPQGWQRKSRARVIQPPPHNPNRSIASSP